MTSPFLLPQNLRSKSRQLPAPSRRPTATARHRIRPGGVAAMFSLHVALHLHGVGVADAVRGTVPEVSEVLCQNDGWLKRSYKKSVRCIRLHLCIQDYLIMNKSLLPYSTCCLSIRWMLADPQEDPHSAIGSNRRACI